jgi:hypothetical protein
MCLTLYFDRVVHRPLREREACRYQRSGQIQRDRGILNHSKHRHNLECRRQCGVGLKGLQCVRDDLEAWQQRWGGAIKLVIGALVGE